MDIVDTGTDLVGVAVVLEGIEQLHVTLGILNRDNIGIKTLDRWEDVVKVRVAEVRVGLELIGDTSCCKFEGIDSPVEVQIPVSSAEGKLCNINTTEYLKRKIQLLTPSRMAGSSTWMA